MATVTVNATSQRASSAKKGSPIPARANGDNDAHLSVVSSEGRADDGAVGESNEHPNTAERHDSAAELVSEALAGMTVMEVKDWLMQRGHTEAVWALQGRRPATKRADWVDLARQLAH